MYRFKQSVRFRGIVGSACFYARAGIEYGDGMEDAVYKYFGVEQ